MVGAKSMPHSLAGTIKAGNKENTNDVAELCWNGGSPVALFVEIPIFKMRPKEFLFLKFQE